MLLLPKCGLTDETNICGVTEEHDRVRASLQLLKDPRLCQRLLLGATAV